MIAHVIVEQSANESFQSKQQHLKQQGFCFTGETFFILLHVNITLWRRHVNSITQKNTKV